MTGCYEANSTVKGKPDFKNDGFELPEEIAEALMAWFEKAEHGDTFTIRCELPT